ncbi:54S ribosomal protein L17 mitochondrial, partial [Clydaea vesicula]
MDKVLYLLIREKAEDKFRLPEGSINDGELLHEAVKRELNEKFGNGFESWVVGKIPVGHINENQKNIFFYNVRIFFGQVKFKKENFCWLSKDEIKDFTDENYFNS